MIGVPLPNPRDLIIAELNQQLDHFFGAGKTVQQIASGVSAEGTLTGSTAHHERLRAERDKIAPKVREQATAGKTAAEAAKALSMHVKRVQLIAQENKFKFAEHS
jgi:predicted polyphosphate/ATP-dependent NAD kinase